MEWLRSTYLYVRAKRSPDTYGMPVHLPLLIAGALPREGHASPLLVGARQRAFTTHAHLRAFASPGRQSPPLQRQPNGEALDRWLRDKLVLSTVQELAKHGMVRRGVGTVAPQLRMVHSAFPHTYLPRVVVPRLPPPALCRCACTTTASAWSRCRRDRCCMGSPGASRQRSIGMPACTAQLAIAAHTLRAPSSSAPPL